VQSRLEWVTGCQDVETKMPSAATTLCSEALDVMVNSDRRPEQNTCVACALHRRQTCRITMSTGAYGVHAFRYCWVAEPSARDMASTADHRSPAPTAAARRHRCASYASSHHALGTRRSRAVRCGARGWRRQPWNTTRLLAHRSRTGGPARVGDGLVSALRFAAVTHSRSHFPRVRSLASPRTTPASPLEP
jgi:hypothetical protein